MRTRKSQSGFTLIEVMVVTVLMALSLILLSSLMTDSAERERETVAAKHMKRILDATGRYVTDNYAALIASSSATAPTVLTPANLRTAKYLGPEVSDTNSYRQTIQIRVVEPSAGQLQVLIVTNGGDVIGDGALRRIARQIGPEGGYIATSGTGSETVMVGAYSGWTATLSTYGAANGGGRIGASTFFRDSQQVSDFIYRSAVAGRPELNTMNTSLDMGNNSIANANAITSSGAVSGATVRATGRAYADEYVLIGGVVTVGTPCTPVGLIAREASGNLTSCVGFMGGGTWRRVQVM